MSRASSYCIEGQIDTGGIPATFQIHEPEPSNAASNPFDMQLVMRMPSGPAGTDGKIRICDLHPGEYRLTATASPAGATALFGTMLITIADKDVLNVRIAPGPSRRLTGQVTWEREQPKKPFNARIAIILDSLTRASRETTSVRSAIPGEFSFESIPVDEYSLRIMNVPRELYVKDITYGGRSVMRGPLGVGGAIGDAELLLVIGQDGGFLGASVADKEGRPISDGYVLVMPASARSEPELADAMISGQLDQNGFYNSDALAPGKYLVLASETRVDPTPEAMSRLWRARIRAKEIVIEPGKTMQLALQPITLE
jgi:hypothetical protein